MLGPCTAPVSRYQASPARVLTPMGAPNAYLLTGSANGLQWVEGERLALHFHSSEGSLEEGLQHEPLARAGREVHFGKHKTATRMPVHLDLHREMCYSVRSHLALSLEAEAEP
jgi:hypothetical protein